RAGHRLRQGQQHLPGVLPVRTRPLPLDHDRLLVPDTPALTVMADIDATARAPVNPTNRTAKLDGGEPQPPCGQTVRACRTALGRWFRGPRRPGPAPACAGGAW